MTRCFLSLTGGGKIFFQAFITNSNGFVWICPFFFSENIFERGNWGLDLILWSDTTGTGQISFAQFVCADIAHASS